MKTGTSRQILQTLKKKKKGNIINTFRHAFFSRWGHKESDTI